MATATPMITRIWLHMGTYIS